MFTIPTPQEDPTQSSLSLWDLRQGSLCLEALSQLCRSTAFFLSLRGRRSISSLLWLRLPRFIGRRVWRSRDGDNLESWRSWRGRSYQLEGEEKEKPEMDEIQMDEEDTYKDLGKLSEEVMVSSSICGGRLKRRESAERARADPSPSPL